MRLQFRCIQLLVLRLLYLFIGKGNRHDPTAHPDKDLRRMELLLKGLHLIRRQGTEVFIRKADYQEGTGNVKALPMKKWFNTNYHYIVPELCDKTVIKLQADNKVVAEYKEAKALLEKDTDVIKFFNILSNIKEEELKIEYERIKSSNDKTKISNN